VTIHKKMFAGDVSAGMNTVTTRIPYKKNHVTMPMSDCKILDDGKMLSAYIYHDKTYEVIGTDGKKTQVRGDILKKNYEDKTKRLHEIINEPKDMVDIPIHKETVYREWGKGTFLHYDNGECIVNIPHTVKTREGISGIKIDPNGTYNVIHKKTNQIAQASGREIAAKLKEKPLKAKYREARNRIVNRKAHQVKKVDLKKTIK